jgi:nicotinate-nucleotide pyrophosphorylase (carboxylating)
VQIEVRNQQELDEAIAGGAESILLDNMTPAAVKKAVKQVRAALPGVPIEAAGSVSLANVKVYAKTGVDFLTVGALTNSAAAVDLGMRISVNG